MCHKMVIHTCPTYRMQKIKPEKTYSSILGKTILMTQDPQLYTVSTKWKC